MGKKRFAGILLLFTILSFGTGCESLFSEFSESGTSAQTQTGPVFYTEEEGPGGKDSFPPLRPEDPATLSNNIQSWWFGGERDDQNRPIVCTQAQETLGNLGLVAYGPDPDAIYLTFDFGYETGYSELLLDTLQSHNAQASFFITMDYIKQAPDTVERMVREGHTVASHSTSHPSRSGGLPGLPFDERPDEIIQVNQVLENEFGHTSHLFRFPEGSYSLQTLGQAAQLELHSIFWSFAYQDWEVDNQPPADFALQNALDAAHPGAIYLLHPFETNTLILGELIDGLRAQGYQVAPL